MGGSSKSSQASTQTTQNFDQDTVNSGGGIAVGAGGLFATQSSEVGDNNTFLDANAIDLSTTLNTTNQQTVSGSDNFMMGDNSSYSQKTMDDNTENVLLGAVNAMSSNANNMMTWAAGQNAPTVTLSPDASTTTAGEFADILNTTQGKVIAVSAVAACAVALYLSGRKGSK